MWLHDRLRPAPKAFLAPASKLVDNGESLLDKTDLVFIDEFVGAGAVKLPSTVQARRGAEGAHVQPHSEPGLLTAASPRLLPANSSIKTRSVLSANFTVIDEFVGAGAVKRVNSPGAARAEGAHVQPHSGRTWATVVQERDGARVVRSFTSLRV